MKKVNKIKAWAGFFSVVFLITFFIYLALASTPTQNIVVNDEKLTIREYLEKKGHALTNPAADSEQVYGFIIESDSVLNKDTPNDKVYAVGGKIPVYFKFTNKDSS